MHESHSVAHNLEGRNTMEEKTERSSGSHSLVPARGSSSGLEGICSRSGSAADEAREPKVPTFLLGHGLPIVTWRPLAEDRAKQFMANNSLLSLIASLGGMAAPEEHGRAVILKEAGTFPDGRPRLFSRIARDKSRPTRPPFPFLVTILCPWIINPV